MNIRRMVLMAVGIALCGGATAHAQWIGATSGSSSTYTTSGNWNGGTVNNDFTGVTLTGTLTLLMPNFSPTTDFKFDYSGDHPMRLQGDGGARTITLGSGQNVSFQPDGTGRTFTAGLMLGSTNRLVHFSTTTSATFTIGAGNTWTQNGQLMSGTFVKMGAGTFNFNRGTANTWTTIDVQGGTMDFTATSVAPGSGRTVTVGSSGTFQISANQVNAITVNLNGGDMKILGSGGQTAVLSSTGGGTLTNNGGFSLGGNVSYVAGGAGKTLTLEGPIGLGATRIFTVANGSQAVDVDVTGALSGSTFGVTKEGAGVMRLGGANTYSGATTVNAGKLVIGGGDINSTSGITVAAGGILAYNSSTALTKAPTLNGNGGSNLAVLSGTGTINAALTLDNTGDLLAPGNSTGILPFGTSQTWNSYTYEWEVNNWPGTTPGTDFDQITIAGSLNLTGTTGSYVLDIRSLTADNVPGNVPNFSETNRSWNILTTQGGITGFNAAHWSFNTGGFTNPTTGSWSISQVGNDLQLDYIVAAVPEPSTMLLGGVGLAVTGWVVRRRRRIGRG